MLLPATTRRIDHDALPGLSIVTDREPDLGRPATPKPGPVMVTVGLHGDVTVQDTVMAVPTAGFAFEVEIVVSVLEPPPPAPRRRPGAGSVPTGPNAALTPAVALGRRYRHRL
jgi:hypothetical protein